LTVAKPVKSRRAAKKNRKPLKKRAAKPRRQKPAPEQPSPTDQAAYVETLIETGQAAPLTADGKLPAGATHAIVEDDQGKVTVVRRRFSIT
jgi:hypothetical protein